MPCLMANEDLRHFMMKQEPEKKPIMNRPRPMMHRRAMASEEIFLFDCSQSVRSSSEAM